MATPRLASGQFVGATVVLESRIPQIIAVAEAETQQITQRAAQNMVRVAKDHSRVDTGAMKAGWQYRRAPEAKTYEVFNMVRYTIFNEFGTVNMSAQPMLAPAMAETQETYVGAMRGLWAQLASGRIMAGRIGRSESLRPGSTFV